MPTPRETILTALHARLSALPATALRGEVLPERIPADGLLILRDGEPGDPEVTLSPLRYHYQHRAEIEAVIRGSRGEISAAHVSEATALWLQAMVSLTAGDTVELQGNFRAADGYFAADQTSFWGAKIG